MKPQAQRRDAVSVVSGSACFFGRAIERASSDTRTDTMSSGRRVVKQEQVASL